MEQKNASYLLFIQDFGNGPLFKNHTELAQELINDFASDYYTPKSDKVDYNRSISRLKAYLSQLFSDSARRNVTNEFKRSLEKIIINKTNLPDNERSDLISKIITDLREKNNKKRTETHKGILKEDTEIYYNSNNDIYLDFLNNIVKAKYIAIFTAREIWFEYEAIGQKFSLVSYLIQDLVESVRDKKPHKYYRFNFPLEQTCQLFWRALRKEVSKYLKKESDTLGILIAIFKDSKWLKIAPQPDNNIIDDDIEKIISSALLEYLSGNNTISVFHLKQPVYLTPSIAINPNGGHEQNTYLLIQNVQGEEEIHKFSNEEFIFWKLFVWDNIKGNSQGRLIQYSINY